MVESPSLENIANTSTIDKEQQQIIAAIDIGTNSIHMVVVKIEPSLPAFTIIAKEKDTVRLGDRDSDSGNLTPEAIERSFAALRRCKDLADSLGVSQIIAVATSATREAPNGQAFIEQIDEQLGIEVNLISGVEEARRIYLGVLSGMDFESKPHIIIDIGGGSTELILADSHEARFLSSTKVGAVRLTKKFVTSDPLDESEFNYLQAYVRGMFERPVENIWANLELKEIPRMVGTSGTIETIASVIANDKHGSTPNPLNGYEITLSELKDAVKRLAKMNYQQRVDVSGIAEKRAEIIVPGAIILLEAMNMLKVDRLIVCERALREGIIVDWMLAHGLIESRLSYQSQVRKRNIFKIAHKYRVNIDYTQKVAEFAISIFTQLQGKIHHWGAAEQELLWAAAILHNCGLFISHSAHHKHSYYLIRNAEILGFTELELEIIANLARYHRKSKPKKKHENYSRLSKKYQLLVSQLSAILRLAVALDRRQIGAVKQVYCEFNSDEQQLNMILFPTELNDKCESELWSINYEKNIFEQEFELQLVTQLA